MRSAIVQRRVNESLVVDMRGVQVTFCEAYRVYDEQNVTQYDKADLG